MSARLEAVLRRRAVLLARSAVLRHRLEGDAAGLREPLALAERLQGGLRWARANPLPLAALGAVALVLRPRRTLAWSARLWAGWRLWQQLRRRLGA